LWGFAFRLGDGEQSLVGVKGRVCAPQAGISSAVDSFRGVVLDEFWRGVVWVDLNLVYCWDNLRDVSNCELEARYMESQTFVDGSLSNFSKFLIPKLETPIFRTFPVAGSFCISCQVFMKSQSGRCFFKSLGSVDEGQ